MKATCFPEAHSCMVNSFLTPLGDAPSLPPAAITLFIEAPELPRIRNWQCSPMGANRELRRVEKAVMCAPSYTINTCTSRAWNGSNSLARSSPKFQYSVTKTECVFGMLLLISMRAMRSTRKPKTSQESNLARIDLLRSASRRDGCRTF